MRMRAALIVLIVIAGAAATALARSTSLHGVSGTVFVTERRARQGGQRVRCRQRGRGHLDGRMVGAAPIGGDDPHDTDKLYTSDEGPDQVSVLDSETGSAVADDRDGARRQHHLIAGRNGKRVFRSPSSGWTKIGVVDTSTDERIAGYVASPLGATARTHAVWITRDGRDLYATNTRADRTQPGDVAKLNARTGELLCTTLVERAERDPTTPNGQLGYVSVRRENKIKELDLTGRCPVLTGREATIGTQPDALQLGGRAAARLVVTLRGTPAQISLMDTETFAVRPVPIRGHVTTGHHWLSANSRYTFVAVETPAGLVVVDNETAEVVAEHRYPVGARAHGVYYQPQVLTAR